MVQPLQQSPQFARALRAYGAPLTHDAPVVMERTFGPVRIGFASRIAIGDLDAVRPRLANVETHDKSAMTQRGYRQILTPAHVAEWDLCASDLRAGLTGTWRTALRRGLEAGLRIRDLHWTGEPHPLFNHADRIARSRKYRSYPTALLARYAAETPGSALIFEAYDRGHLCGAILVLRHGAGASYQTAWSDARGRALGAARVLLDHAAHWLQKKAHKTFDLGYVETDHAPGLARFKLGTGATLRPLGGTWLRLT